MKGFKKGAQNTSCAPGFAGGGAAKGVPSMRRRGHPVAAKKALVAPPPSVTPVAGVAPPSPLRSLTSGAMGRGAGQVAVPQGGVPPMEIAPPKMVKARPPGLAEGGLFDSENYVRNRGAEMSGGKELGVTVKTDGKYDEDASIRLNSGNEWDRSDEKFDRLYPTTKQVSARSRAKPKLAAGGMPMPPQPASNVPMGGPPSVLPGAPQMPPQASPMAQPPGPPPMPPQGMPPQGMPPQGMGGGMRLDQDMGQRFGGPPQGMPPMPQLPPQALANMQGIPRQGMPGRGGVPVAPRGPMLGRR